MNKSAIIFLAWGERYINEVYQCLDNSPVIQNYDLFLITDEGSVVSRSELNVIRADFQSQGLLRKTELIKYIPPGYDVFLLLDSDTIVLEDIGLGFSKAMKHGIAMAPAPHYSLDYFFGFGKVMKAEGMTTAGQLQYNTGVVFFNTSPTTLAVFEKWHLLAKKYQDVRGNDQPFFSLAMEQLDFNPYTLSISYNYRGYGEAISGIVRIWHSHKSMPDNINQFNLVWPPRRAFPGKVVHPEAKLKTGDQ